MDGPVLHLDRAGLGDWSEKLTVCGLNIECVNTTMRPGEATCPKCRPMNDGSALLRSIIEAPDDDAPRLVYADWLDENGDGDRAELIRVQCESARLSCEAQPYRSRDLPVRRVDDAAVVCACPYCTLRRRERDLLTYTNLCRWLADVPVEFGVPFRPNLFRRGFLWALTLTAEAWLRAGDAILAAAPVTEVWLTTWPDHQWQMGNLPPGWPLGRDGAERLVALDALEHRWPTVQTWHLPPEPTGEPVTLQAHRLPVLARIPDEMRNTGRIH